MLIGSRYFNVRDYDSTMFRILADTCHAFYLGKPHPYGAKRPESVRMHVTREWEYPYALLAADAKSGDCVLDLGCGGSPLPTVFAWFGCRVVGLDRADVTVAPPSLRSYGRQRTPIPVIRADMIESLPFCDESFNVVTCISTFEGLPQLTPIKALGEVSRVLRPGGRFVATIDVDREGTEPEHVMDWLRALMFNHDRAGLRLRGPLDGARPDLDALPCTYHVFGAVLEKA